MQLIIHLLEHIVQYLLLGGLWIFVASEVFDRITPDNFANELARLTWKKDDDQMPAS